MTDSRHKLRLLTEPRTEAEAVREALAVAIDAGDDERARGLLERLRSDRDE
jgi:hypothetical protein